MENRYFEDFDYIPEPFPKERMEPLEWTQILATLDICVNELTPTRFCDDEGYDLIPFNMIQGVLVTVDESHDKNETKWEKSETQCLRIHDKISIVDIELKTNETEKELSNNDSEDNSFHDAIEMLQNLEVDADDKYSEDEGDDNLHKEKFFDFPNQKPRRQKHYRQKREKRKQRKNEMPTIHKKTAYLRVVGAVDCIKDKILGKFSQTKTKAPQNSVKNQRKNEEKMTKLERKQKHQELKQTLKKEWTTKMESENEIGTEADKISVPSHYKKYTIKDRRVVIEKPLQERTEPGQSYDGLEDAKKIDLAEPGEEPKSAYIATDLSPEEEETLV
ncbi:hypothetical protein L7F22_039737 [Adiantum nelumboides]|nr:hypothetical protein [Adiantum nelumboides]